jgi:two-component system phosphate regulon sensor histidine kinase PhoR
VRAGDLEQRAQIADLLLEMARQLGETLEPERVYARFHEILAGAVRHDAVVVSSYDERDGLIRCDFAWVEGTTLDPAIFPPVKLNRSGGGMQSRVIVTGEPLLVNDVAEKVQEPQGTYYDIDREGTVRKLPDSGPPGTSAVMMVPVKHEQRVVGVVQLMSDQGAYAERELEVFVALVSQMAAAVRNARLQRERARLEAAEAVAGERERAARVLEVVGDGIFLVDDDGVVRLWNRAAALATGVGAERALGERADAVFGGWEALATRVTAADDPAAARPMTLPVEVHGRDLWLSFVAVRGADGVVYAFRDVTSERGLEEQKSDFIATISHELRTPMAAVFGAAQTLLQREQLTDEQRRQLVEMIATQAARLTQITEEVLLASRLDRGEIPLESACVDVGALARGTVEAMRSQLPHGTEITVEVESDAAPASGDADRLQQVLVNLLDNAVKYGAGPVQLRVGRSRRGVSVAVADAGPGIPRPEQARIFEKFYRGDPQLSRAPSGTGLGLYISRELVRRMGGRLDVDSGPGRGTTFVVELPPAELGA